MRSNYSARFRFGRKRTAYRLSRFLGLLFPLRHIHATITLASISVHDSLGAQYQTITLFAALLMSFGLPDCWSRPFGTMDAGGPVLQSGFLAHHPCFYHLAAVQLELRRQGLN
jgi:hypothetical protein